jgi:hypothetical protein
MTNRTTKSVWSKMGMANGTEMTERTTTVAEGAQRESAPMPASAPAPAPPTPKPAPAATAGPVPAAAQPPAASPPAALPARLPASDLKGTGVGVAPLKGEEKPARPVRLQIAMTQRADDLVRAAIESKRRAGLRGHAASITVVVEEALEKAYGHLVTRPR